MIYPRSYGLPCARCTDDTACITAGLPATLGKHVEEGPRTTRRGSGEREEGNLVGQLALAGEVHNLGLGPEGHAVHKCLQRCTAARAATCARHMALSCACTSPGALSCARERLTAVHHQAAAHYVHAGKDEPVMTVDSNPD